MVFLEFCRMEMDFWFNNSTSSTTHFISHDRAVRQSGQAPLLMLVSGILLAHYEYYAFFTISLHGKSWGWTTGAASTCDILVGQLCLACNWCCAVIENKSMPEETGSKSSPVMSLSLTKESNDLFSVSLAMCELHLASTVTCMWLLWPVMLTEKPALFNVPLPVR